MDQFGRRILVTSGLALAGVSLLGRPALALRHTVEVTPVEDLMREHGALNRILLIYEELRRRIANKSGFAPEPLNKAAVLIQDFIEGYHEKLEEEFVLPRLEKSKEYADLSRTIKEQHQAGRKLTERILELSRGSLKSEALSGLDTAMDQFIRMYRPHEAFEDTVIFPAFKKTLTPLEDHEFGEKFEEREHKQFGKEGFEGVLAKISAIEKNLGIHDLNKFTPPS